METNMVSFQAGQSETEVILVILDDSEPEGQEVFFVYLSDPEGGAQITDSPNQGFGAFATITILGINAFVFLDSFAAKSNRMWQSAIPAENC